MQKSYPLFLGTINFKIAKNDRQKHKKFYIFPFRKFCVLDIQYSIYLGYKNNSNSVVQFYYKARKKNTDSLISLSQPQSVMLST